MFLPPLVILQSDLFDSGFLTWILYAFLISPMRATRPANPILYVIILTIFGEEYKLLGSTLCSFHHPPVT
jgi:hypothetical protein